MLIMEHQDLRCCARINTLCCRNVSQCITSIMKKNEENTQMLKCCQRKTYRNPTNWVTCSSASKCFLIHTPRRGLATGSTGTFPGGLAADLARCPVFLYIFFFIIIIFFFIFFFSFAFPMCQSDHFRLWHSLINHKSVSLDRQHRASRLFLASKNQRYLTAIRTYFTRWLIRTNSYDLTRTI